MQGLHHAHHVIEDDHGLPLAEPFLLDDVMLQVDQVSSLVTEVMCTEAVEDKADALFHLLNHSAGFCVLHDFTGAVLGGKGADGVAVGLVLWDSALELDTHGSESLEQVCMYVGSGGLKPGQHVCGLWGHLAMPGFLCARARPSQGLRLK